MSVLQHAGESTVDVVHAALSRMVGERKSRGYSGSLCRVLAALYGVERAAPLRHNKVAPGWRNMTLRLEDKFPFTHKELDTKWANARRRNSLLPVEIIEELYPQEIWPAVERAINAGPRRFITQATTLIELWAGGETLDGNAREPLGQHSIDGYLSAIRRFAKELCELRKLTAPSQTFDPDDASLVIDDTHLSQWISEDVPSRATIEAEGKPTDRTAPPLLVVRRALRALDSAVQRYHASVSRKRDKRIMQSLRNRALLGVATLAFRDLTLRTLCYDSFLPEATLAGGYTGPALRISHLKGHKPEFTRLVAIPELLARWIQEWIDWVAAQGFQWQDDTPLWLPLRRSAWGTRSGRATDGIVYDVVVSSLAPFAPKSEIYSPHRLRHLAEKLAQLAAIDWFEQHKYEAILTDVKGMPSSPQTIADAAQDHALHDLKDRYNDMDTEPAREEWRRVAHFGQWEYVWGELGARKGPDVDAIVKAKEQLEKVLDRIRRVETRVEQYEAEEEEVERKYAARVAETRERLEELDELAWRRYRIDVDDAHARARHFSRLAREAAKELVELQVQRERAQQALDAAIASEVAYPDDIPQESIPDSNLFVVPNDAELVGEEARPRIRAFVDPNEFRWAIGEQLLPASTLRRWIATGKLGHPVGDKRNLFCHNADGTLRGVERLSARKVLIHVDDLPLERYHVDAAERLRWILTQPYPARVGELPRAA